MADTPTLAKRKKKKQKKDDPTTKTGCKCKDCPCSGAVVPFAPPQMIPPQPSQERVEQVTQPRGPLGAYEPGGGSPYCTDSWGLTRDAWGRLAEYNYCTGIYMFQDGSTASHNNPGAPIQWWQTVASVWNNFKYPVPWHDRYNPRYPAQTIGVRG